MKKNILILFGGTSPEHNVSLQSAQAVLNHLDTTVYRPIPMGITHDGQWLLYKGPLTEIANGKWSNGPATPAILSPDRKTHGIVEFPDAKKTYIHAVLPILHGQDGEDGTVQGLARLAGIPCAGCGALSSALAMDKDIAHQLVSLAGLNTAKSVCLSYPFTEKQLQDALEQLSFPLYIKPAKAGSSLGISRVTCKEDLPGALKASLSLDSKILLEEEIQGAEVGCAVLGNDRPFLSEIDEIELNDTTLSYAEKYTPTASKIHLPARISPQVKRQIQRWALTAYRALQCSGMARMDFFLTGEGELYFNEANTIPGFTPHSRYPSMLMVSGLSFTQILSRLIQLALDDEPLKQADFVRSDKAPYQGKTQSLNRAKSV